MQELAPGHAREVLHRLESVQLFVYMLTPETLAATVKQLGLANKAGHVIIVWFFSHACMDTALVHS